MKLHRVYAFLLRHVYEIAASIDRKADVFFFPIIDVLVFGLLTVYIDKFQMRSGIAGAILGGIILWTLVYNITRDIAFTLLEDAWSRNLYNLFSSPLRLSEVIVGTLIISIVKVFISTTLMVILARSLFDFNLFGPGLIMGFYILNIFIFGWAFGFFTSALILRYGTKVQSFSWSLILLFYPVSGVFYPLDILPSWLATLARALPLSHVFGGLREILMTGKIPPATTLFFVLGLNLLYLILGITIFVFGFAHAKKRGWFVNPI